MNREKAIKLLKGGPNGIAKWNDWRSHGDDPPFLSAANLRGADLSGADLRFVSLALARLDGANLSDADLTGASLRQADLFDSSFQDANLSNAEVRAADLSSSNLEGACCRSVDFAGADLNGATLHGCDLSGADLTSTDLSNTDLSEANLRHARLIGTRMHGSRVTGAQFGGTVISCGLTGVTDLDETIHHMPSPVAVSSILSLSGETPVAFLRGCGLRAEEIAYFKGVLIAPVRFNACFLTYHEADRELAEQIHRDLQDAGIRCWKRLHRQGEQELAQSGEIERINCGINRIVLLASRDSLNSPAILREIAWAIRQEEWHARERPGNGAQASRLLFPVQVDDYIRNGWEHPQRMQLLERTVAEVDQLQENQASYQRVLDGLLASLRIHAAT